MSEKTQGLIIKEQTIGESDRLVWVLTKDMGVLRAFARRAKNLRDSKSAATQLLCYSDLSVYRGKDKYAINDARPIEVFFDLRRDVTALALAQYFCELAYLTVPAETESETPLRIILNSLHFLAKGSRPQKMLKAVTELRLLCALGYLPNLVACTECAAYEHDPMYFLPDRGVLYCGGCFEPSPGDRSTPLSPGALTAMRHIAYADFEKLYSFSLPADALAQLSEAVERYTLNILHTMPKTLEFYHAMAN